MRMMWGRVGRAAALTLGLAVAALPMRAETLTDALIAAYRNSNLLEQNRAVLRAADEDVAVALSALRPLIAIGADASYSDQRLEDITASIALSAEITLFDFGRNRLAVDVQKEVVLATREALVNVEQQVLLSAVRAYVGVRLSEEIVSLRQSNERLITQELRAAQDRFDLGETTRTDVALAEARLATSRSDLIAAQGDLLVARENYRLAVGRYPGNLAPPPRAPRTARSLDEARGVASRTHPSIRQAQREVTIGELNMARARASFGPTVTGRASLAYDSETRRGDSVAVGIDQTLYAGGRLSALYRQALARRDEARSGLLQTTAEIGQQVGEAWANLTVAAASIEASDREIEAAQTAFDGVREEANLGARTTLDVLDAEQDLLSARTNRVSVEANRYVSVYVLLSTMGLLTVDHLGLGIPTYDPAAYYNAVKDAPATSAQGKKLDRVLKSIGRTSTD
ncbi:MAG: TolC family outer membrane protein [Gemmobacter sp.]